MQILECIDVPLKRADGTEEKFDMSLVIEGPTTHFMAFAKDYSSDKKIEAVAAKVQEVLSASRNQVQATGPEAPKTVQ
jgi:hypothetical protein